MSRHRNIRNYAYEEDMYEDVYGHSVEEHDLCVSPTTAQQFMFHRGESQHPNLSSFMEESLGYDEEDTGELEEHKDYLGASKDYKTPKLDKESEAKLRSCMDEFRSILGDHCDEEEATTAILKHNFDLEQALDEVLSKGGTQDLKSHDVSRTQKDVLKIEICSKQVQNPICLPSDIPSSQNNTHSECEVFGSESNISTQSKLIRDSSVQQIPLHGKVDFDNQKTPDYEQQGLPLLDNLSQNNSLKPRCLKEASADDQSITYDPTSGVLEGVLGISDNLSCQSKVRSFPSSESSKLVSLKEVCHEGGMCPSQQTEGSVASKTGSLRELSQGNAGTGFSLLNQLSSEGHIGTSRDQRDLSTLGCQSVASKIGSSKIGSLRELSQGNAGTGISLSQLSSEGHIGTSRDQRDLSSLGSVSLREISQTNKERCTSLLSQLSTKGQDGTHRDQTGITGSLRGLSVSSEDCSTSPLSQLLAMGQTGKSVDMKGYPSLASLAKGEPEKCVSLSELSLSGLSSRSPLPNDRCALKHVLSQSNTAHSSPLMSLSAVSAHSSPLMSLTAASPPCTAHSSPLMSLSAPSLPCTAHSNRLMSLSAPSPPCTAHSNPLMSLSAPSPPCTVHSNPLMSLSADPPVHSNPLMSLSAACTAHSNPLMSLSAAPTTAKDMPKLSSLSKAAQQAQTSLHGLSFKTTPTGARGAFVPLEGVTLASLSAQFDKKNVPRLDSDIPRLGSNIPRLGYGAPRLDSDIPQLGSGVPRLDSDIPRLGYGAPRLDSDIPRLGSGVPRLGSDIPRFGYGVPRLGSDVPRFGSDIPRLGSDVPRLGSDVPRFGSDIPRLGSGVPRLGSDIPRLGSGVPRLDSDIPRFGYDIPRLKSDTARRTQDIDLSVSLKRNQPRHASKTTAELTHPKSHLKESLQNSIKKLNLNTVDSPSDEIDGGFRHSTTDVEDGSEVLLSGLSGTSLQLLATPTMFARTLFVIYRAPRDIKIPVVKAVSFGDTGELSGIVPFNFSTQSPDDIVKSKQKEAFWGK